MCSGSFLLCPHTDASKVRRSEGQDYSSNQYGEVKIYLQ